LCGCKEWWRNRRLGLVVNARNNLILTGFLKRTFGGEIEKDRDLCGGENYNRRELTILNLTMHRPYEAKCPFPRRKTAAS
jgi:hypothetical protein